MYKMRIVSADINTSQVIGISVAKIWKQLKYPLMDEQLKNCDIYVQWNIIQP